MKYFLNMSRLFILSITLILLSVKVFGQQSDYDSIYFYQNCIILDAKESTDQQRDDLLYHWNFGDSTKLSGQIVEHCYDSLGTYEIVLSIADTTATSLFVDEWNFEMVIKEDYLLSFGYSQTGNEVSFITNLKAKDQPEHVQYFWDFGNGLFDVGSETSHAFEKSGSFDIRLLAVIVNGDDQLELSSTKTIQIIE